MSRGAVAALGLVLAGWPLAAVGQTAITPDVGARGLGTTVGQAGTVFTIDGGSRSGANLFHSFSQFDLASGATANWVRAAGDGASIANVVNRVTGGQASTIAGKIDSTALPNAAFYFINPAGIVFGAGAQVNVPGAAHFSTAAELRFADGASFAVATPGGSTLSVAAPEAFGFVGGQGAISVAGVTATFTPGNTPLSFSAANVVFTNANFGMGGLDVAAVGAGSNSVRLADPLTGAYAGEIRLRDSGLNAANADAPVGSLRLAAGLIDLDNTRLVSDTAGAAAGADIHLKAGSLRIGRDSLIVTSSRGAGRGGQVEVRAGDLVLDGSGSTTFTAGISSVATASGPAGLVRLTADNILAQGGAFIGSSVGGSADAGDIQITATNFVINSAIINTANLPGSTGQGSSIRLRANAFDFGAAAVTTQGFGSGRAGDVILEGGSLVMSGGSLGSTPGGTADSGNLTIRLTGRLETDGANFGVSTFSDFGEVGAGAISISSSEVFMQESRIFTQASGQGAAGRVLIDTGNLIFDEVLFVGDAKDGVGALPGLFRLTATGDIYMRDTFFRSNANGLANGGIVEIRGRNIELEGTLVQSDTIAQGQAGRVFVAAAQNLRLFNTQISSSSNGEGAGGDVRVEAGNVRLEFSSSLRSDAAFLGDAGGVSVSAQTLHLQENSDIASEARRGTGDAGEVRIDVDRLTVVNGRISSSTFTAGAGGDVRIRANEVMLDGENAEFTSIESQSFSEGAGGNVFIDAGKLTLDRSALVSTASRDAAAGDVFIAANEVSVLSGSSIVSASVGFGAAGDVSIKAGKLALLSDERFLGSAINSIAIGGAGGKIDLDVTSLTIDYGSVLSDTFGGGDAGDVRVKADTITLRNLGNISSSTQSLGNAGTLSIQARDITLEDGANILSAAKGSSDGGNAGALIITADRILVGDGSAILTSTLSTGDAGELAIQTKSLIVNGGAVSSAAQARATGQARNVRIDAEDVQVLNGGSIDTRSVNPNPAGFVDIRADRILVDGDRSVISSENSAGDPEVTGLDRPGPGGDAGNIRISTDNLTISNGGRVTTNSFAGAAGDIEVRIERPGLFVLEGAELPGVIQTSSGPGTGGKITISDPLAIISNGGLILALGQQRGANVQIQSRYFIESTDRPNIVEVAGDFQIQTGLYDVSSGTVSRDLSVLDASKVLRGQCPAARSSGAVSQLITRPVGPYAREPAIDVLRASPPGGCP